MHLHLWIRLRLGLKRLYRMCNQSCWTLESTSGTAHTYPPSSERILDTYILALRARWCRSTTFGFPKYVKWCYVRVSTFIYTYVCTNTLILFVSGCWTTACSAISRERQAAGCDSSKWSHHIAPIRLLSPLRASRPLEARDPHLPLHRRRADANSSGYVPVDGHSLWGRGDGSCGHLGRDFTWWLSRSVRERSSERTRPHVVPAVRERSRTGLGLVAAIQCTYLDLIFFFDFIIVVTM
jgi:hypothetical protein